MKKFLLATSARVAIAAAPLATIIIMASANPVRAADQTATPHLPTKTAIVPPAVTNWTGCYIGVHGGGGAVSDTFINTRFEGNNNFLHGGGAFGGGQIGCNYQSGNFVFGLEGEAWSGLTNPLYFISPGDTQNLFTRNRWNADVWRCAPASPSTARSSTARPASPRAASPSPRRTFTAPSQAAPRH
jgi:opacity protein-like surface antigen